MILGVPLFECEGCGWECLAPPEDWHDHACKEERRELARAKRAHDKFHATVVPIFRSMGFRDHGPWESEKIRRQAVADFNSGDESKQRPAADGLILHFFYESVIEAVMRGNWMDHPSLKDFSRMLLFRTFVPWPRVVADLRAAAGPLEFVIDPTTQIWDPNTVVPVCSWRGEPSVVG